MIKFTFAFGILRILSTFRLPLKLFYRSLAVVMFAAEMGGTCCLVSIAKRSSCTTCTVVLASEVLRTRRHLSVLIKLCLWSLRQTLSFRLRCLVDSTFLKFIVAPGLKTCLRAREELVQCFKSGLGCSSQ
jgi:hypothetical protein